jgi:hypothetical protein
LWPATPVRMRIGSFLPPLDHRAITFLVRRRTHARDRVNARRIARLRIPLGSMVRRPDRGRSDPDPLRRVTDVNSRDDSIRRGSIRSRLSSSGRSIVEGLATVTQTDPSPIATDASGHSLSGSGIVATTAFVAGSTRERTRRSERTQTAVSSAAIAVTWPPIGIFALTVPACGSGFGFGFAHTRRFFPWTFLTLQCAAGTGAAPTVPTNARTAAESTRTRTAQRSH